MLKESALYLCENSAMPQSKMREIYDKVADSVKSSVRSETYYRNIIENIQFGMQFAFSISENNKFN